MSTADIAQKFAALLKAGKYADAEKMWAEGIVSIENMDGPMKRLKGREAVHGKGVWWFENHEVHSTEALGPFVNGDSFAMIFKMDVTQKQTGQRIKMDEVGLYKVKDGEIVEERFFY